MSSREALPNPLDGALRCVWEEGLRVGACPRHLCVEEGWPGAGGASSARFLLARQLCLSAWPIVQ